ncbi:MAG: hypothetical protein OHK0017_02500 [Patescibacteria group bacterium]
MENTVMVGGAAMYPSKDIVENITQAPNLTTVVKAVQTAGLVDALKSDGPLTVFGPNNAAFEALPAGTVETLLKPENKQMLTDILTYHVVSGKITSDQLTDGKILKTLNGQELKVVKKDGKTYIQGAMANNLAEIETADVYQKNGVAHVIKSVLLPDSNIKTVGGELMYASKNIVENVSKAPNLTTVVSLVKAADLVTALSGNGPLTVFGPDNDAFNTLEKNAPGTTKTLTDPANKATLAYILQYHVISGKITSDQLTDGKVLTTLNGEKLTVSNKNGVIKLMGAKSTATIKTADVLQSNGVAHVIDTVLIPAK